MHTRLYLTPADHGRALSWEEFAWGCGWPPHELALESWPLPRYSLRS